MIVLPLKIINSHKKFIVAITIPSCSIKIELCYDNFIVLYFFVIYLLNTQHGSQQWLLADKTQTQHMYTAVKEDGKILTFWLSSLFLFRLTTGSSNLMGKFTQSVRRIVQDVKDEGTMSGLSREEVIEINERLILFRFRLEASYETAKQALNALITKYSDSKSQRNIFHRYPMLKVMIKVSTYSWEIITLLTMTTAWIFHYD